MIVRTFGAVSCLGGLLWASTSLAFAQGAPIVEPIRNPGREVPPILRVQEGVDRAGHDRALLIRYRYEDSFRATYSTILASERAELRRAQVDLEMLLLDQRALAEKATAGSADETVARSIARNEKALAKQRSNVDRLRLGVALWQEAFDRDLVRLRKLWAGAPLGFED
jgi:hypothetical protein